MYFQTLFSKSLQQNDLFSLKKDAVLGGYYFIEQVRMSVAVEAWERGKGVVLGDMWLRYLPHKKKRKPVLGLALDMF